MPSLTLRSIRSLKGVHPDLVKVVTLAAERSGQGFTVIEGVRSAARQAELFKAGASKTMTSRHLSGHAVDLAPSMPGDLIRFEWALIYPVAAAMDAAAADLRIPLRWGGVWDKLMSEYGGSPEALKQEVESYCVRHPGLDFLDGPHYELPKSNYP